jgi:hypothetical protein
MSTLRVRCNGWLGLLDPQQPDPSTGRYFHEDVLLRRRRICPRAHVDALGPFWDAPERLARLAGDD